MSKKQDDLVFGDNFESKFKEYLENDGYKVEKLGKFDHFDFLINDKIYIEVKNRRCKKDKYPTTKVRLEKYQKSLELTTASKGKNICLLVINWEDNIGYINILETPPSLTILEKGRWDRGWDEIAHYAHFDIDKFADFSSEILKQFDN